MKTSSATTHPEVPLNAEHTRSGVAIVQGSRPAPVSSESAGPLGVDALLAQMRTDSAAVAFVLEAGPLTEEELAARTQLPLARIRYALDFMGSRGEVGECDGLVTRRRGR